MGEAATIRMSAQGMFAAAVMAAAVALGGSSTLPSGSGLPRQSLSGSEALARAKAAGIDVGAVIETVRHHVAPSQRTGALVATDPLYRAEFASGGMTLFFGGSQFKLGTTAVRRGG